jgi:hypothetical protein
VAICLFDAIVALNVSKIKKKNEYFCIFLSLSIYSRCFFYETMFSGPRRFFCQNDFCNTGWDNHPEEDNLEDGVMLLEKLENALFDDEDHADMPPPTTTQSLVSLFRTPAVGDSSSSTAQFRPSQSPPLPPRGGTRVNCIGGRRMG